MHSFTHIPAGNIVVGLFQAAAAQIPLKFGVILLFVQLRNV
jgi:hypothetical protein